MDATHLETQSGAEHDLIAALVLSKLSDDGLYMCFHHTKWERLTVEGRKLLLQEVENRQARLDGRKPITVLVGKLPGNVIGRHAVYPDGRETITIDETVLRNDGLSSFTAADALDTVLHEGRHAFQHNSILNDSDKVPERIRLEWSAVMGAFGGKYTTGRENYLLYVMQSIEMDARRFARRKVQEIGDRLAAMGMPDDDFTATCDKLRSRERLILAKVRETFTLEEIDAFERDVLEHFRRNNPDKQVDHLKIFDHVRLIIQRTDIETMDELLELLDKQADEAMDAKLDKKLDQKLDRNISKPDHLPGLGGRFRG